MCNKCPGPDPDQKSDQCSTCTCIYGKSQHRSKHARSLARGEGMSSTVFAYETNF